GGCARLPLVLPYLEAQDPALRKAAAIALGDLRQAEAVKPLLARLESEADFGIVEEIAGALAALDDPRAIFPLEVVARAYATPRITAALARLRQGE
ncbi:MAG: hypothetical protein HC915_21780, partial [Anaerolineae bacterium]|nr:hypothetical protein [Anaerolineae bacterium]